MPGGRFHCDDGNHMERARDVRPACACGMPAFVYFASCGCMHEAKWTGCLKGKINELRNA